MNDPKILEAVADAIDAARYAHPGHPRERPIPFNEAHPTDREYATRLANAAIKAYRDALWAPAFDISSRAGMVPELRRIRADQTTAHIMHIVGKYLCDHGEARGPRDAARDLVTALYESGAEVITDSDRATAGLRPRGPHGLTAEELRIRESRMLDVMRQPMPMFLNQQQAGDK